MKIFKNVKKITISASHDQKSAFNVTCDGSDGVFAIQEKNIVGII